MSRNIKNLAAEIRGASRKKLFGSRQVFERYEPEADVDLSKLETKFGFKFPGDLRQWLEIASFGDLDQQLAIRVDWLNVIDRGELIGHVIFGQDDLGNFYSFDQKSGQIHYICRSAPEYAPMSENFTKFLRELLRRDFQIVDWAESLSASPYAWGE